MYRDYKKVYLGKLCESVRRMLGIPKVKTDTPFSKKLFTDHVPYLVINLSGEADAVRYPVRCSSVPPDVNDDVCRTTEMWFRLIPPGMFMMGSPVNELGHHDNEVLHQVSLTKPFYMGVFQVTQEQYRRVMDEAPSYHKGTTRPVGNVSYNMLRGSMTWANWPTDNGLSATSFFGILRRKTGMTLDLPTEAQWEYACRAGTTTALNSGKNLTDTEKCPNMAEVGRYNGNHRDGKGWYKEHTTSVGMYLPNAWGLYDMHGNVQEWCLDWYGDYGTSAVTDPKGAVSGSYRIRRGGGSNSSFASYCRSAYRYSYGPGFDSDVAGFRACVLPPSMS